MSFLSSHLLGMWLQARVVPGSEENSEGIIVQAVVPSLQENSEWIIVDAKKLKLLFACIGVPLTSTEPYFMVRCPQLGIGVRSANGSSGCSFVIPVSSQPSFRSLYGSMSEFLILAREHFDKPLGGHF